MMKNICTEIQEKLLDYIDGGLGADEMAAIKTHLAECSECRREYKAQLDMTQGLARIGGPAVAPEKVASTAAMMSSARKRAVAFMPEPAWERVLPIALPVALAVGVLVLFALEQFGYINIASSMPRMADLPNMPAIALPDKQAFLTLLDRLGEFVMQPWVILGVLIVACLEAGFFLFDMGD